QMCIRDRDMANTRGYTREQMDDFAIRSLKRAQTAITEGYFKDEIVPVTVSTRKGDVIVDQDEQPLNAKIDKIPSLKPAFAKDGTITAVSYTHLTLP
ncbi:acetyl-CoA C-acyltransferase, partial [Enterobacter hormaechei]